MFNNQSAGQLIMTKKTISVNPAQKGNRMRWITFRKHNNIMNSSLPLAEDKSVQLSYYDSPITNSSETWCITKVLERK